MPDAADAACPAPTAPRAPRARGAYPPATRALPTPALCPAYPVPPVPSYTCAVPCPVPCALPCALCPALCALPARALDTHLAAGNVQISTRLQFRLDTHWSDVVSYWCSASTADKAQVAGGVGKIRFGTARKGQGLRVSLDLTHTDRYGTV